MGAEARGDACCGEVTTRVVGMKDRGGTGDGGRGEARVGGRGGQEETTRYHRSRRGRGDIEEKEEGV